jgi:predicted nucleic acid-binding protein
MKTISLKLAESLLRKLERAARDRGQTKSEVVRAALEQFLNGERAVPPGSALEAALPWVGCVAFLDRRDQYHDWIVEQMAQLRPPMTTCEPVVTEAYYLLRHLPRARESILEMLAAEVVTTSFQLSEHADDVLVLLQRYANVPMSLADACLVGMSELVADCVVVTLDSDFRVYRRHRRQKIPLVIPPDR